MSQTSKVPSKALSKAPTSKAQEEMSYRSEVKSQLDQMSIKSFGSSSIRTTTTTRERLADIER